MRLTTRVLFLYCGLVEHGGVLECIVGHLGVVLKLVGTDRRQTGTVGEGLLANLADADGNVYADEADTVAEGFVGNRLQLEGEADRRQSGAAAESLVADGGQVLAESGRYKVAAALEGTNIVGCLAVASVAHGGARSIVASIPDSRERVDGRFRLCLSDFRIVGQQVIVI